METWWIVLVVIVLVALAIGYVVRRRSSGTVRVDAASPTADRDYAAERETSRMGNLSTEDQAWQAASLEKDRANRGNPPRPPEDR